uniref:Uncharacterized protein n=1 Tax=Romanomermis culicivorax TaxID=13658 RepID=A0A915KP49_ROMCU
MIQLDGEHDNGMSWVQDATSQAVTLAELSIKDLLQRQKLVGFEDRSIRGWAIAYEYDNHPICTRILKLAKRQDSPQNKKEPLTIEHLQLMVAHISASPTLANLRIKAIMLICFIFLHISEALDIRRCDLKICTEYIEDNNSEK